MQTHKIINVIENRHKQVSYKSETSLVYIVISSSRVACLGCMRPCLKEKERVQLVRTVAATPD